MIIRIPIEPKGDPTNEHFMENHRICPLCGSDSKPPMDWNDAFVCKGCGALGYLVFTKDKALGGQRVSFKWKSPCKDEIIARASGCK